MGETSEQAFERMRAKLPEKYGNATLEPNTLRRVARRFGGGHDYLVDYTCGCGRPRELHAFAVLNGTAPELCRSCNTRGAGRIVVGAPAEVLARHREIHQRRQRLEQVPWERDHEAQELVANGPLTLNEIGEYYGLSRERIRQIEATALRKLRRVSSEMGLQLEQLLQPELLPRSQRWATVSWGEVQADSERGAA